MNKDKFLEKLSLLFDAHVSGDTGETPITWGYINISFNQVKNKFDILSKEDLESIIKRLYIDIASYNHKFIDNYNNFQAVVYLLHRSLLLDLNDYKSIALDNKQNSVYSNTLKKKEKIMSEMKEKNNITLTISDSCIGKRSDGSIVIIDKDSEGKPLKNEMVFITLPQRKGEDFRVKFTTPKKYVLPHQADQLKGLVVVKRINSKTNDEFKTIVSFEKKNAEGKWIDCSNEYKNEDRALSYDQLVSRIKETFKNLNARKEVDGKDVPAFHIMWLPKDAANNVPTIRVVPEINAKTGEKNISAGMQEITLPKYAKVHSFKTYAYDKESKTFTENPNTEFFNLNFAKFYVNKVYTGKEDLQGIPLNDDDKIRLTTARHESKDGKVYESTSYFVKASDVREAIKEDYRAYKKNLKEKGMSVEDIKSGLLNESKNSNQVASKTNEKKNDLGNEAVPY